jgi:hypothetical protein
VTERRLIGLYAMGLLVLAALLTHWMRAADLSIDVSATPEGVRFEGFAAPDASGRWSIATEPRVRFDRPLPQELTLRVSGRASAANIDRDIVVRIPGGAAAVFRLSASDSTQEVRLTNPWSASAITWTIPGAQSPGPLASGDDDRELGIALTRLEVLP